MTIGDNFAALRAATASLNSPATPLTLTELMEIDQSNRVHVDAFIHLYVHTPELDTEFEEQFWQALHAYLQPLNHAYISALQGIALQQDSKLLSRAFLHSLDNLALLALCHYLRYQPLPDDFWPKLHEAYRLAEETQGIDVASAGCDASYLQALMLGTVNHTNMLKWEIVLVNRWLQNWCKDLSLDKEYDEKRHLYFVDLLKNGGARRMRDFTPALSYRYWHVDNMAGALKQMQQQLEADVLPADFGEEIAIPNAMRFVEQLLAEWSRTVPPYRRQRRVEDRDGAFKSAQAVHGIFNVCQHVKNVAFANLLSATHYNQGGADLITTGSEENSWIIENESKSGFGAVVKAGFNLWLKPGCLIALDYEFNPDLTVVGVVRSIQQQSEGNCYAGIEVLSHTATYVLLQYMNNNMSPGADGGESFPALYLAKDDDRDQPAMLVMPSYQFMQSGLYQLRTQRQTYRVSLGDVIEQQHDWLRAKINTMDRSA